MMLIRIMLVEDSGSYAELVKIALRKQRCDVWHCETAESAITMLDDLPSQQDDLLPHLMLLDVNLPGMSGIELARQMKAEPRLRTMPIVMLTTSHSQHDVQDSYAAWVNSYVVKPNTFEELKNLLRDVIHYWGSVNVVMR